MPGFGEFEFIAELLSPLAAEGAFGLTDDAALLPALPDNEAWVVTKDAMVLGTHFRPMDTPDMIARKLMRVNVSDLAGMGARPIGYMLALALDTGRDRSWLESFCTGLARDQREYGMALFGGDTTSTAGLLTLSLTAFGSVPRGQELRRNGANPGDNVWVTGTIGDAALGLHELREPTGIHENLGAFLAARYWLPRPQLATGLALRGHATACLDVSDGLLADLGHIAEQSGCGIDIDFDHVPLSAAARAAIRACPELETVPLNGGDDYELAFTLAEGQQPPECAGVQFTHVGQVVDGDRVTVIRNGEIVPIDKTGWRHF
jgi:thiamine-monophosphate kinase